MLELMREGNPTREQLALLWKSNAHRGIAYLLYLVNLGNYRMEK
jgi:hypothetical protein